MPNQNKSKTIIDYEMDKNEHLSNAFLDKTNEGDESNGLITETESACMRTLKIIIIEALCTDH